MDSSILLYENYPSIMRILVTAGANPDVKDGRGETLLTRISIIMSDPKIIKLLIKASNNLEEKNDYGENAFTNTGVLLPKCYEDIVRAYIEAGVNLDAQDREGCTVLMVAAMRGRFNTVKLLLNAGADLYIKDKKGYTVFLHALFERKNDIAEFLIDPAVDVKRVFYNDPYSFANAVSYGNESIVRLLIDNFKDINMKFMFKETVLMFAVRNNNENIVKLILDRRPDLECVSDYRGKTALTFAVESRQVNNVKLLVKAGVDLQKSGHRALELAASRGSMDILKFLIDSGVKPNGGVFMAAVEFGKTSIIRFLVEEYKGLSYEGYRRSAFEYAIMNGHKDTFLYLKKIYPDKDKKTVC